MWGGGGGGGAEVTPNLECVFITWFAPVIREAFLPARESCWKMLSDVGTCRPNVGPEWVEGGQPTAKMRWWVYISCTTQCHATTRVASKVDEKYPATHRAECEAGKGLLHIKRVATDLCGA